MTDWKKGDTVRSVRRPDYYVTVEAVHESSGRFWGIPQGGDSPLTYQISDFEKVEPFFEVGKKYKPCKKYKPYCGDGVFEPVRIDTDDEGRKFAYGCVTVGSGGQRWRIKDASVFTLWTEV